MPDQIDQQFRQLMGEVRGAAPAPEAWDDVMSRRSVPAAGRSRGWLVGAAAAAVVLIIGAAIVVLVGTDDTDQIAGTETTPTTNAEATAGTTPATAAAPTTVPSVPATSVAPSVPTTADGPPPEPEPALVVPTPTEIEPGDTVELTYPTEVSRGAPWYMYPTDGDAWAERPKYLLIATFGGYDCGGCERWTTVGVDGAVGWDDIGFVGPGPDSIVIPDTASGRYRVCDANGGSLCFQITVRKVFDPPAAVESGTRLVIDPIGLDVAVGTGIDEESVAERPGLDPSGVVPGELGVASIFGNRTTYQAEFNKLDVLQPGDTIEVTTPTATHVYRVDTVDVVAHDTPVPETEVARLMLSAYFPRTTDAMQIRVLATLVPLDQVDGPPTELAAGTEIALGVLGAPIDVPQPWPVGTIFRGFEPGVVTVSFVPPDPGCIAGHATATIGRAGAILISVYVDGERDGSAPCVDGAESSEIRLEIDESLMAGRRFYSSTIPETAGASAPAEALADAIIGLPRDQAITMIEEAGFIVRDNTGMDAVNDDRNLDRINIVVVDRHIEWAAVY